MRRRFLCKRDMRLRMRGALSRTVGSKTGTSKPGGYRFRVAATQLCLGAAPRDTGCGSTSVTYAVWVSAGRFARAFDNVDYFLERVGIA
jgi:hypothetical protein